jgi:hypothetical protein
MTGCKRCICSEIGWCNDIGVPFDDFDQADDAHLNVSSHAEVKAARAMWKSRNRRVARKQSNPNEMSFVIISSQYRVSSTRLSGLVSDDVEIKPGETAASRMSNIEIGQRESPS